MSVFQSCAGEIWRSIDGATSVKSKSKRQIRAVWSNERPDRHRSILMPDGCDYSAYMMNPLICAEHGATDRGLRPIGEAISIEREMVKGVDSLVGTMRFYEDDGTDPEVELLWRDYAAKRRRGWSINAMATKGVQVTDKMRSAHPVLKDVDSVYSEWELLEVSAVTIPSNRETLTQVVDRSYQRVDSQQLREYVDRHKAWCDFTQRQVQQVLASGYDQERLGATLEACFRMSPEA